MDASRQQAPPWVDPSALPKLWIDVTGGLPWLMLRPYLVEYNQVAEVRTALSAMGFDVVEATIAAGADDPERALLVQLTRKLRLNELGVGTWAAFGDRLWDFLKSENATAVAVVIIGLDDLVRSNIYNFIRCIHNLLSITQGLGISDSAASRQLEYFFVGHWTPASSSQRVLH